MTQSEGKWKTEKILDAREYFSLEKMKRIASSSFIGKGGMLIALGERKNL